MHFSNIFHYPKTMGIMAASAVGLCLGLPAAVNIGAVGNCSLTTNKIVRLRADASTTSKVLTRLPYNTTWKVTGRVAGWYQIIWTNTQGWVSDAFVRATGECGNG